jgi:hypothetical protein
VRSTADVLEHHLKWFASRDLDGILERLRSRCCVLQRGRSAARAGSIRDGSIQLQALTAKIRPKN